MALPILSWVFAPLATALATTAILVVTIKDLLSWAKKRKKAQAKTHYARLIKESLTNNEYNSVYIGLHDENGQVTDSATFKGKLDDELLDLFGDKKEIDITF